MYIKKYTVKLIWILVCYNIRPSQCNKDETKHIDIENDKIEKEQTTSTPTKVESRFFDLGGVINQLFPGFNQGGGVGGNPGLNLPSNSQFYPGVPAQNWQPQALIDQGNGWFPNQQINKQPTSQNLRLPSNRSFNQQGSINNMNQAEQYPNQGSFGQYPGNLNGNPINGGVNQNDLTGNFQYPGLQQGQPYQQILSNNNNQYQGQLTRPDQVMSNLNNNRPVVGSGVNYPREQVPSLGQGQSMIQNPNGENTFNNQYYNQPIFNRNSQNPNNQGLSFSPQQQNQNNWNQQSQYPNGQFLVNGGVNYPLSQGTPSDQQESKVSNKGQNNRNTPQLNTNTNLAQNFNNQGVNINNDNDKPNTQIPEFNRNPQGTPFSGQQTIVRGQEVDLSSAIRFPNDDDYNANENIMTTRFMTTISPTTTISPLYTRSPSTKNAIVGKPVFIPTTTISSSQVTFTDSDITTASQKECVQNCPTSSEYNPVCGTDGVAYFNPGRLVCAQNCGISVFEARQGNC
ncbi:unnamed protein product [Chilo suppressalis]|uniref:Kazal-like domain-containing protein n=1 Tax=Chilo suppressalis TaxID=168631 RepID=A0ABN8BHI1_CHISP|nr:hypothetical protein evm_010059 [Chilo suppressalis]CAH0406961.1 unnamed protein product [Chilo suppressalis]